MAARGARAAGLTDQSLAHPMRRLQVKLLGALGRDEFHRRAHCGPPLARDAREVGGLRPGREESNCTSFLRAVI